MTGARAPAAPPRRAGTRETRTPGGKRRAAATASLPRGARTCLCRAGPRISRPNAWASRRGRCGRHRPCRRRPRAGRRGAPSGAARARLHHHQPERMAGDIDAVPEGVGAEQAGVGIIAEDVDQSAGVDRVNMLGVERQARAGEPVGDAGVDGAQALDRGEQAERAALGRLDQPRISPRERGEIAFLDVGDDEDFAVGGIIERARRFEARGGGRRDGARRCAPRHWPSRCRQRSVAEVTQHRRARVSTPLRRAAGSDRASGDGGRRHIRAPRPARPRASRRNRRRRPADPRRQRDPRLQDLGAPREAADRAFDPGARGGVEPVGCILDHRLRAAWRARPAGGAKFRAPRGRAPPPRPGPARARPNSVSSP